MKEIKAYIRHEKAEEVVHALEKAGASWLTAVNVDELGIDADLERAKFSMEFAEKICPLTKIEVVCSDEEVGNLVEVLRDRAWTSRKGDGIILVSDLQYVIKIRTGESGEEALLTVNEKE
jgi:nitrogen regulatory protein PII